jgi:hypothetical protein
VHDNGAYGSPKWPSNQRWKRAWLRTSTALRNGSSEAAATGRIFRVVQVTVPPGTIANAVRPAATAARGLTGFRQRSIAPSGRWRKWCRTEYAPLPTAANVGVSLGGYGAARLPAGGERIRTIGSAMRSHRRRRGRRVTPPNPDREWRLLGPPPDNSIGSARPALLG